MGYCYGHGSRPGPPSYASPHGCSSNFPTLHLSLLALLHFLHRPAKERSASPSPSITSRLFAKTAGVPSPAFFSSRCSFPTFPPANLLAQSLEGPTCQPSNRLVHFYTSCTHHLCTKTEPIPFPLNHFPTVHKNTRMPPGAFPDFSRRAARPRPISGHFPHFSPPERSPSPFLYLLTSSISLLPCRHDRRGRRRRLCRLRCRSWRGAGGFPGSVG